MTRRNPTVDWQADFSVENPAIKMLSKEFNALGIALDLTQAEHVTLQWKNVASPKSSTQTLKLTVGGDEPQLIEIKHSAGSETLNMSIISSEQTGHIDYAYNLNEGGKLHVATFHLVSAKGGAPSPTDYQPGRMIDVGGHPRNTASLINILDQGRALLTQDQKSRELAL